jgi:glycosyltransferase involved in cell wall biosynthesis
VPARTGRGLPVADRPLRVTYDASAVPADPGGAGYYTLSLAAALDRRDDVDLVVVTRRSDRSRWESVTPGSEIMAAAPDRRPARLAWEQARLPGLVADAGADVHHGPHYTMPERSTVPAVVTVHDLSFFEAPEWHQRSKVLLFKRAISVAARRAAVVVCPSRATAGQLSRWCRVRAEVVVAHHGVDTSRFAPGASDSGQDGLLVGAVDRRLNGGRFLLFVGTLEPRKDVPTLVAAFARVAARHPDVLLVLGGALGWGAEAVERAVSTSGVADRVVRTGYLPDDTVPALLRRAALVVYPALYEGFGLPALEALACGALLVTTSGTAMEEVAGDAAVLVPPGDVAALAEALDTELSRPTGDQTVAARRRRGLDVASAATWEASAARHLAAYRSAAGRGGAPEGAEGGGHPVG